MLLEEFLFVEFQEYFAFMIENELNFIEFFYDWERN